MDYRLAEFVRYIAEDESIANLVNEAKSDTWTKAREHAVLIVDGFQAVLVRGGLDEIDLMKRNAILVLAISGSERRITKLAWHIHPRVTGPSDFDRRLLSRLVQAEPIIFGIGGEKAGTIFSKMSGEKR